MAYRQIGGGYDWTDEDGRPSFVSIGEDRPIFSPIPNPVDQHVQFAQDTYARGARGQQQGAMAEPPSPAVAALAMMRQREQDSMAGAIPGLTNSFNPRAPVGYGMIGNQAYVGGQPVADPEAMRRGQMERTMGYLDGSNAAGTVDSFFSDPRVAGRSPDQVAQMYDSVFGKGRLQQDMLANQLSKQRAAIDPNGYTPVTYRDVNEYQSSMGPEAIKAATERLGAVKSQYGISALELLHSIGANNMANLPAKKDRNGMDITPASQVFMHPAEQANIRRALNTAMGMGSYPAPESAEIARLRELAAKRSAPAMAPGVAPAAAQVAAAPGMMPGIWNTVDPNASPFMSGLGAIGQTMSNAADRWLMPSVAGLGRHMARGMINAGLAGVNMFRPGNDQVPWVQGVPPPAYVSDPDYSGLFEY